MSKSPTLLPPTKLTISCQDANLLQFQDVLAASIGTLTFADFLTQIVELIVKDRDPESVHRGFQVMRGKTPTQIE